MIASVDPYLARTFHPARSNCLHLACDVWRDATGEDLTARLADLFDPVTRRPTRDHFRGLQEIPAPVDPCLVLFERPCAAAHVGVFIRGRVLHMAETGAEHVTLDVALRGFARARFYR